MSLQQSFLLKQLPSGEVVCILDEAAVIDVTATPDTPINEGVRGYVHLDDTNPCFLDLLGALLSGGVPIVKRCLPSPSGQGEAPRVVVLAVKPSDSNNVGANETGFVVHEAAPIDVKRGVSGLIMATVKRGEEPNISFGVRCPGDAQMELQAFKIFADAVAKAAISEMPPRPISGPHERIEKFFHAVAARVAKRRATTD